VEKFDDIYRSLKIPFNSYTKGTIQHQLPTPFAEFSAFPQLPQFKLGNPIKKLLVRNTSTNVPKLNTA